MTAFVFRTPRTREYLEQNTFFTLLECAAATAISAGYQVKSARFPPGFSSWLFDK